MAPFYDGRIFFTDGQTDFLDGGIFARMVSNKNFGRIVNRLSKKVLNKFFWALFLGHFLGKFWPFLAILAFLELFP